MKDRWLKAAYRDDHMVADLLLRLKQPLLHHPPPFQPPLSWGHKQPRSTPVRRDSTKTTRCSPRTPLSWTAAAATASPSDGGCDEPSVGCATPDPLSTSRSKISNFNSKIAYLIKKDVKIALNVNFSHLTEEETEVLKEGVNLKRDLQSIHVNLKEHRNMSDNLKRIKLDLNEQSTEAGALSTQPEALFPNHPSQMEASTANLQQSTLLKHAIKEERPLANSCRMQEVTETNKRGFVVPDLNMPVGDDEIAAESW